MMFRSQHAQFVMVHIRSDGLMYNMVNIVDNTVLYNRKFSFFKSLFIYAERESVCVCACRRGAERERARENPKQVPELT